MNSTIAAARASNEQRNCIADARQIMDMHMKRLGLLEDFEEVMYCTPCQTHSTPLTASQASLPPSNPRLC